MRLSASYREIANQPDAGRCLFVVSFSVLTLITRIISGVAYCAVILMEQLQDGSSEYRGRLHDSTCSSSYYSAIR